MDVTSQLPTGTSVYQYLSLPYTNSCMLLNGHTPLYVSKLGQERQILNNEQVPANSMWLDMVMKKCSFSENNKTILVYTLLSTSLHYYQRDRSLSQNNQKDHLSLKINSSNLCLVFGSFYFFLIWRF